MHSVKHGQAQKLDQLLRAAHAGSCDARRGTLFCSQAGLALVNAAFDLFECDALYDLAADVTRELHCRTASNHDRMAMGDGNEMG